MTRTSAGPAVAGQGPPPPTPRARSTGRNRGLSHGAAAVALEADDPTHAGDAGHERARARMAQVAALVGLVRRPSQRLAAERAGLLGRREERRGKRIDVDLSVQPAPAARR